jgi:S-adenosylmethionine hydrolase
VEATYAATFSDVEEGAAAVLLDSDGCLALSVNCGRADSLLDARSTQPVTLKRL